MHDKPLYQIVNFKRVCGVKRVHMDLLVAFWLAHSRVYFAVTIELVPKVPTKDDSTNKHRMLALTTRA